MTPRLLDAAMGSALLEEGLSSLPERWLAERPDAILAVHAAHAAAGAELVLTCTFNLAGPRLREAGIEAPVEELARAAVAVARRAAPRAAVAGAVGPTMLDGVASPAELRERYAEAFGALARAGCDLLWTESHWDLPEARAALGAALATGLPAGATMALRDEEGALRAASGEAAGACLAALASDGALAVGLNCALPGAPLAPVLRRAAEALAVPVVAKPSAGLPGALLAPAAFGRWLAELAAAGASWVGGCCGAGAAHLAAARAALRG